MTHPTSLPGSAMTGFTPLTPRPGIHPRVFVDRREAVVIRMAVAILDPGSGGIAELIAAVELPWIRCTCDGTDHAMCTIVVVELCGEDEKGNPIYWDTGVLVKAGDGDGDIDGDELDNGPDDGGETWQ